MNAPRGSTTAADSRQCPWPICGALVNVSSYGAPTPRSVNWTRNTHASPKAAHPSTRPVAASSIWTCRR